MPILITDTPPGPKVIDVIFASDVHRLIPNWTIHVNTSSAPHTTQRVIDLLLGSSAGRWAIVNVDSGDERVFDHLTNRVTHTTARFARIDLHVFNTKGWLALLPLMAELHRLGVLAAPPPRA